MKNIVQLVFMSAACSIASAVAETAKFTALVLDDATGEPIANVRVNGGFDMNHGWLAVKGSPGPNNVKGVTDGKGWCELKGETNTGRVWFYVEDKLPSHYSKGAGASASFAEKNGIGLWQPENLVLTAFEFASAAMKRGMSSRRITEKSMGISVCLRMEQAESVESNLPTISIRHRLIAISSTIGSTTSIRMRTSTCSSSPEEFVA